MKLIASAIGMTIGCSIMLYFGSDVGFGAGAIFGAWVVALVNVWKSK